MGGRGVGCVIGAPEVIPRVGCGSTGWVPLHVGVETTEMGCPVCDVPERGCGCVVTGGVLQGFTGCPCHGWVSMKARCDRVAMVDLELWLLVVDGQGF